VLPDPEAPETIGVTGLAAFSCGLRNGGLLAEARRQHPDLLVLELPEPLLDTLRGTLRELLESFSPEVSEFSLGEWGLDLTGCERLVKGEWEAWGARLCHALQERLGLGEVHLAIAGTRIAARLLARNGSTCCVCPAGEEAKQLSGLPLSVLPDLEDSLQAKLARMDVRSLGDLAGLPRRFLVRRLGPVGERLCAQARGLDLAPAELPLPSLPAPELPAESELELFAESYEAPLPMPLSAPRRRTSRAWKGRVAA
jgi:DNA polymerase-4